MITPELVIGATFATIGTLVPVRFPSGRRFQFVFAIATLALFLVAGLRAALVATWVASCIPFVRALFAASRDRSRTRRLAALLPTPIAMSSALVVGHGIGSAFGSVHPLPLGSLRELVVCIAALVAMYATFVVAKEWLARALGERANVPSESTARERGTLLYGVALVTGGPLLLLCQALYLLAGSVPWAGGIAWSLLFNVAVFTEARTAARTSRVLRQLIAREKRAAIGEVTARVADQTRHPIGLIGTSLERIESRLADLDDADAEVVRAELAKLENAQEELRQVLVRELENERRVAASFRALTTSELANLADVARHRQIRLEVDLAAMPAREPRDPVKVAQGFFNVVENAIVAAGTTVWIAARIVDEALVLSVEDDGPGMSDADLARATEPFFTTKATGTGMGLSIARAAVEAEGGSLELARRAEGGLRVALRFPD